MKEIASHDKGRDSQDLQPTRFQNIDSANTLIDCFSEARRLARWGCISHRSRVEDHFLKARISE